MNRFIARGGAPAFLLFFSIAHFAKCSDFEELNSMKATVNGEPITSMEVNSAVATQIQIWIMENRNDPSMNQEKVDAKVEELKEQALQDLIDRKLILAKFKEMGGTIKETYVDQAVDDFVQRRFEGDRQKFLSELKKSGMTIRQFRDVQREQITIQALRGQNDGPEQLIITPPEKKDVFNEIKGNYATETRVILRMISLPKETSSSGQPEQEKLAKDIRKQLGEGQDFATMAKTYSSDSFAGSGGLVGEIGKDMLNKKLTDIAFGLTPGRVSELIDDGPFWRLLYVDEKKGGDLPGYSDLEDTCEKIAIQKKRKGYVDRWLDGLRRDASIRIY